MFFDVETRRKSSKSFRLWISLRQMFEASLFAKCIRLTNLLICCALATVGDQARINLLAVLDQSWSVEMLSGIVLDSSSQSYLAHGPPWLLYQFTIARPPGNTWGHISLPMGYTEKKRRK